MSWKRLSIYVKTVVILPRSFRVYRWLVLVRTGIGHQIGVAESSAPDVVLAAELGWRCSAHRARFGCCLQRGCCSASAWVLVYDAASGTLGRIYGSDARGVFFGFSLLVSFGCLVGWCFCF